MPGEPSQAELLDLRTLLDPFSPGHSELYFKDINFAIDAAIEHGLKWQAADPRLRLNTTHCIIVALAYDSSRTVRPFRAVSARLATHEEAFVCLRESYGQAGKMPLDTDLARVATLFRRARGPLTALYLFLLQTATTYQAFEGTKTTQAFLQNRTVFSPAWAQEMVHAMSDCSPCDPYNNSGSFCHETARSRAAFTSYREQLQLAARSALRTGTPESTAKTELLLIGTREYLGKVVLCSISKVSVDEGRCILSQAVRGSYHFKEDIYLQGLSLPVGSTVAAIRLPSDRDDTWFKVIYAREDMDSLHAWDALQEVGDRRLDGKGPYDEDWQATFLRSCSQLKDPMEHDPEWLSKNLARSTATIHACSHCGASLSTKEVSKCGVCSEPYCDKNCQKASWKVRHKRMCPDLARARGK